MLKNLGFNTTEQPKLEIVNTLVKAEKRRRGREVRYPALPISLSFGGAWGQIEEGSRGGIVWLRRQVGDEPWG